MKAQNDRTVGTWLRNPIVLVVLWILVEWFFTTQIGLVAGLIIGLPLLAYLIFVVGGFFYVFKK